MSSQAAKDSVINASQAIEIFLAKARRKSRDPASRMLAEEYGISMKAVRDIWNFRTWKWETMPYWSQEDLHDFLSKHLCTGCRLKGVCSLQEACGPCAFPRRRGRRRIVNKATPPDLHSDAVLSRRARLLMALKDDEVAPTVVAFPLLGMSNGDLPRNGPVAASVLVPDDVINPHPRFGALTKNIRERRGSNVEVIAPLFQDDNTTGDAIKADAMAFGVQAASYICAFVSPRWRRGVAFPSRHEASVLLAAS